MKKVQKTLKVLIQNPRNSISVMIIFGQTILALLLIWSIVAIHG